MADQSNDLNLMNLIESRIIEILHLENEARRKKPKLFSQRLPRYMRRRAACHNEKRLPYKVRLRNQLSNTSLKVNSKLLKYRRRLQFRKHKRLLRKHSKPNYPKDPLKSLVHKWFAKRFKMMDSKHDNMVHVPLHNNTKNQRNLRRQRYYGCCFLSMAHMISLRLELSSPSQGQKHFMIEQLEKLNLLTKPSSGFTFCAEALENSRYEVKIDLYNDQREFLCQAHVFLSNHNNSKEASSLIIWIPRDCHEAVRDRLKTISELCRKPFKIISVMPKDCVRFRLFGQDSRKEALKLSKCDDKMRAEHNLAIEETDERCLEQFKFALGRHLEHEHLGFTYYNTKPRAVDIVFKGSEGRLLWYKLIKHRAHLVGGYRDFKNILATSC